MRDSLLAVSGALDTRHRRSGRARSPSRRSRRGARVYGFIDRQNLDGLYRTFDFAVPDATSPRRFVTTVPQQALFLMNSPFLHEQARRLAGSVAHDRPTAASPPAATRAATADPAEGVRRLYRRVLGRLPEPDELSLAVGVHSPAKPPDRPATSQSWQRAASTRSRPAAVALGAVEPGAAPDQRVHVCGLIPRDALAKPMMLTQCA